ncbi:MAG TPA: hypothetical protein PLU79_00500 [Burkholderiaceae bacterium]|nr:hypothetical protein [Burkholderiaceae bacterium]
MNALRRGVLVLHIRALEAHIDGCAEALEHVADPQTQFRIQIARHKSREQLARLRSAYNALLPPGQRRTWRMA